MNETWQVDGSKVIEVGSADEPVRRVSVRLIGGRVDVVAHDEPEARLEIHAVHGRPLDVSWDEHELVVAHPQARWDSLISGLVDKLARPGVRPGRTPPRSASPSRAARRCGSVRSARTVWRSGSAATSRCAASRASSPWTASPAP